MKRAVLVLLALAAGSTGAGARQQASTPLDTILNALPMRNIGPFRTGAWVTSIDVPETPTHDHLYTIYAASRSGEPHIYWVQEFAAAR